MRVAVYYNNEDIRIEERAIPKIGPDELLVKVIASGICGSDVMEWYRVKKAPRVLGHEIAGIVAEAGKTVKDYKAGDRVFVSHHVPCNSCRYCRAGFHTVCETLQSTNFEPGGFAEYIRVPSVNMASGVYRLPDELSFEDGTFIEPLGCVVRGQRIAGIKPDDSVLVLGSGISGLLHINLLEVKGVAKIIATDINEYRLKAAFRFGADVIVKASEDVPARVRQQNGERLADRIIVCTGALPAFKQAFKSVDRGGTILLFAPIEPGVDIPIPLYDLYFKGVTITFSYAAVTQDINDAIQLLREKEIKTGEMITHRFGLGDIQEGFRLVAQADNSIKVIIEPQK